MVARVVWDHEAAGSSPVTSTIGMRRRFIEICGASVIRTHVGQYRIILSADTASEARQLLSQKRR